MTKTTKEQRAAMFALYQRARNCRNPTSATYRQFRRRFVQGFDCLMINIWGQWLGIERDGYIHS